MDHGSSIAFCDHANIFACPNHGQWARRALKSAREGFEPHLPKLVVEEADQWPIPYTVVRSTNRRASPGDWHG
jgi:hypothetical protein